MSSYGLLLALSGFTFDKGAGRLGFAPPIHKKAFRAFWSLDGVWGVYEQSIGEKLSATLSVLWGETVLRQLDLSDFAGAKAVRVTLGHKTLDATLDANGTVTLRRPVKLKVGARLTITFRRRLSLSKSTAARTMPQRATYGRRRAR
jgi:hypothetical protein